MMQKICSWLRPPVFPQDEEKTRVAAVLNGVLLWSMLSWLLALPAMPWAPNPALGAAILSGMIFLAGLALFGLRRGLVYPIGHLVSFGLWAITSLLVAFSGGISSPEAAGFVMVMLIAGLFAGVGWIWFYGLLSLISASVIYMLTVSGALAEPLLPTSPLVSLVIVFANLMLATALLILALSSLSAALRRARQSEQLALENSRQLQLLLNSLEERVSERTRSAETARAEAESARQAMQTQIWLAEAHTRLSRAIQGEQTLADLGQKALSVLCPYLNARIGMLYLREDEASALMGEKNLPPGAAPAPLLRLAAGYTAPLDAPLVLTLGEGLAGQVGLDGRPVRLSSGEAAAIRLASGLGDTPVQELLIYPLLDGEQIVGVLELAWLDVAAPPALEKLLAQLGSGLAIALRTAQARQRVDELLKQTQSQAAEMQAQEEELRAVNEELLAQAEAVRLIQRRAI